MLRADRWISIRMPMPIHADLRRNYEARPHRWVSVPRKITPESGFGNRPGQRGSGTVFWCHHEAVVESCQSAHHPAELGEALRCRCEARDEIPCALGDISVSGRWRPAGLGADVTGSRVGHVTPGHSIVTLPKTLCS
jgi:hypothetical protein